jgi:hypothetical protein
MIRRFQNQFAESRFTLHIVAAYAIGIWLLCGLLHQRWWVQFACFALSALMMVLLNNNNALIRVYSRSVSAFFIGLSCMACFLFPSMEGAIAQLCFSTSLLMLYRTYQDKTFVGTVFYTYVFIGLGSLADIQLLWFVPILWIIQAGFIFSIGIKSFFASLLGLILPYWFFAAWTLFWNGSDFSPFVNHFIPLVTFQNFYDYHTIPWSHLLTFIFIVVLAVTGIIHFLRKSYLDKIRVRQVYYSLFLLDVTAMVFGILQPQHYDLVLRLMIITTSPLIAHFVTFTNTRITNIAFYVITGTMLLLTGYHLWISSFIF